MSGLRRRRAARLRHAALTTYSADDGQDVGDITWTPDGQVVVYVRGGDFEFPGRPDPNPALLSEWRRADHLYGSGRVEARRAEWRRDGRLRVSPDGKTIAFLSKEGIWTAALEDESAKPVLDVPRSRNAGCADVVAGWEVCCVCKRSWRSRIYRGLFAGQRRRLRTWIRPRSWTTIRSGHRTAGRSPLCGRPAVAAGMVRAALASPGRSTSPM